MGSRETVNVLLLNDVNKGFIRCLLTSMFNTSLINVVICSLLRAVQSNIDFYVTECIPVNYCTQILTSNYGINCMVQCITNRCYMCIHWTRVLYSAVIKRQI